MLSKDLKSLNKKRVQLLLGNFRLSKGSKLKAVLAFGLSGILFGGIAFADYVLQDGTKVEWMGGNSIKITHSDGTTTTTSNTTRTADGRLVATDGSMSSTDRNQANQIGRQTTGSNDQFTAGTNTVTIPVYQNGQFVGYANNHQNSNGLGRTYYTSDTANGASGSAVVNGANGGSADFNWTQVDLSTPPATPPSGGNTPTYTPPGTHYSPVPDWTPNPPPAPTNLLSGSSITHNPSWEAIRVKNARPLTRFYAGEKFVVHASTSTDASSVRVTFNFPQAVKDLSPALRDSGTNARPEQSATFELTKSSNSEWSGSFWKKSWVGLPDGTYTVTITATFHNGQTRSVNQTIQIANSILDFANGIEKIDQ